MTRWLSTCKSTNQCLLGSSIWQRELEVSRMTQCERHYIFQNGKQKENSEKYRKTHEKNLCTLCLCFWFKDLINPKSNTIWNSPIRLLFHWLPITSLVVVRKVCRQHTESGSLTCLLSSVLAVSLDSVCPCLACTTKQCSYGKCWSLVLLLLSERRAAL